MPSLPRCVIFDLDGTLLDSLPGIEFSARAALAGAGVESAGLELRGLIGPPIRTILGRVAATEDATLLDRLESGFRMSYDSEGWRRTPCFPGAAETLRRLRQAGHRLFVASNKPGAIARRILEEHGLAPQFEEICTRDSARPPYPDKAAMLAALLSRHGLAPEECVMVGDTMEDAEAAALHGLGFIFVEYGYGELPRSCPVLLRLDNLSEFPETTP
jgi:phosphoglycolate phosphatase